jgi:hypothetical protein
VLAGASSTAMVPDRPPLMSIHPGLRVPTTKYAANKTVTDWENNNQKRFMDNAK